MSHGRPRNAHSRRDRPHVPEVRPGQLPQPDRAAAGPGLAALRAHAHFGDTEEFTEEELANAIRLDASQIAGLGPSIDALSEMLLERKRKILATYETKHVQKLAADAFRDAAEKVRPPAKLAEPFRQAVKEEQLYDLEQLYFRAGNDTDPFASGSCSSRRGSARSTRSTNWPRSTSSPAARRWTCPRPWK